MALKGRTKQVMGKKNTGTPVKTGAKRYVTPGKKKTGIVRASDRKKK
jgi:hypothetical protein